MNEIPPYLPLAQQVITSYSLMREEGIRYLQYIVGEDWSDFNSHDPGITILEALCYALTDLGYRIEFPLPDLLARSGATTDSLFPPDNILPTGPVTLTDWHKLVSDVPGVRNAWVRPVETQTLPLVHDSLNHTLSHKKITVGGDIVQLKGLYGVQLDAPETTIVGVQKKLNDHRPLGEDVIEFVSLSPQPVVIKTTVEITATDDAEGVMLSILQSLDNHISPPVPFVSLQQLFDLGQPIDAIFTGPLLTHGFIDCKHLENARRRTELRASDLIQVIMDIPSVKAVRAIQMQSDQFEDRIWTLSLDPARVPRLKSPSLVTPANSQAFETNITLQRNGLEVQINMSQVKHTFDSWRQQNNQRQPDSDLSSLTPARGRNRHLEDYTSIMHHLPDTYGVGELGLPAWVVPEQKAKAKQLQAYLLLFDQLLANAHAQLAHVGDLFSTAPTTSYTYFAQPIADPTLNLNGVMPLPAEELQNLLAANDGDRQHRFLNHLLARFAESLADYALVGEKEDDVNDDSSKILADKQAFLRNYPDLSRNRGAGFNYLEPTSLQNRSGLEKRLQYKLGLDAAAGEEFFLVEHILLRPISEDEAQTVPLLVGNSESPLPADPYSLQLSFVFPEGSGRLSSKTFRDFVTRTIHEETPAHLCTHIQWFSDDDFIAFKEAYTNWLEKLRLYQTATS